MGIVSRTTYLFLRSFTLSPQLWHSDGSNGFSPVGVYIQRYYVLLAALLLWLTFAIFYPVFFGEAMNVQVDTLAYIILVSIIISYVLIVPARSMHNLMKENKNETLEAVAREMRPFYWVNRTLSAPDTLQNPHQYDVTLPNTPPQQQALELLRDKYDTIKKEQRTWPFTWPAYVLKVIFVPLLLSLVPVVVQLLFGK